MKMAGMNFKHLAFSAFFGAACLISSATSADEGIKQFKQFISTVNNAEGEFSQQQIRATKQGESQSKVLRKSQGRFIFQRPGKFVWETIKPFEQKVIADGQKLLLWDKDLNQLTVRPESKGFSASPAAILFGGAMAEEYFDLIPGGEKGGMFWVELKPKATAGSGDMPYSRIGVGMSNGLPAGLELHDNFGTIVLINLSKIRTNINLSTNTFKFSPPAGADVLNVQ
jgi:outer membrane lipoprotein carrier protein